VVRHWARSDKASLVRHANNRNIWRNLTDRFPHPYTDADAEAWFGLLEGMREPSHWAIEVDGEAVGAVGCILGKGMYARSAQFGYWLAEQCWGRGIMTAAVSRVAPYAMQRFNLARLQSPVFAWNPASMRVLEKSGFAREARLKCSVFKDGQLIDELIYALVETTRS
jgi:RimJ/RimL family protein N-acetyltransferase